MRYPLALDTQTILVLGDNGNEVPEEEYDRWPCSDLTSVNFYRNHISLSIHPDLPILYAWFLTLSCSIIAIIAGFDPLIHKRLEGISAESQFPKPQQTKYPISRNRWDDDHSSISVREIALDVPKFDVTADEVLQSSHRSGLKTMLQSPSDRCKMCEHNVCYLRAWIFLLFGRPLCEGLLYCHCKNFCTRRAYSVGQSGFLDHGLVSRSMLGFLIIDCALIIVRPWSMLGSVTRLLLT